MKMFFFATAAIVFCSLFGRIKCEDSLNTISVNVNQSCSPDETECRLGCCPFSHGVCCIDGFECCQNGQTCIPYIGICIGAVNDNGNVSLTSSKTARIRTTVSKCPSGTTTCGPDKCCLYEQAVCCSDGKHCCPNGYKCDIPLKQCIKDADNAIEYSVASLHKPLQKVSRKYLYKSCPGGNRICPNYMNCCVKDNGIWGCCPNPSLPQNRYGAGECCVTIFGIMCCPGVCYFWGCFWLR